MSKKEVKKEVEEIFTELINSEEFTNKIIRYTEKTAKDLFGFFIRPILFVSVPLVTIIISLLLYVFTTVNGTISKLAETTSHLENTVSVFSASLNTLEDRTKANQEDIKYLLKTRK